MKTLIHLVSEQTMQNLLPILAFKPERVVQIRSRPPKFKAAAAHLRRAVEEACTNPFYADLHPEFVEDVIEEDSPSVESTQQCVSHHVKTARHALVNITGGTKLMSLGASRAAEAYPDCLLIYCDTSQQQFVSLDGKPLPSSASFQEIAQRLTLKIVMAAHGVSSADWTFKTVDDQLLDIGRTGYAVFQKNRDAFQQFREKIRRHFRPSEDRVPEGRKKLEELCQTPIPVEPDVSEIRDFLEAAVCAGLLRRDTAGTYRPALEPSRKRVEELANILDGSWLELYVLSLLKENPNRWSDPHWSVQVRSAESVPIGETDLVCVEVPKCALHLISCKTHVRQPLETLESFTQRRRDMGGLFAKATLAALDVRGNEVTKLRNWSLYLNVHLLIGNELEKLRDDPH